MEKYIAYMESVKELMDVMDHIDEDERKQRAARYKRKIWTKKWLLVRQNPSFTLPYEEFRRDNPEEFEKSLRLNPTEFDEVLSLVADSIRKRDTVLRPSISPERRLLLTLRYLSSGGDFKVLAEVFRIAPSTIAKIIPEVCNAIYKKMKNEFIKCPESPEDWHEKAREFASLWQYPRATAAIDGKHIEIDAPPNSGAAFFNFKQYYSIVLMAIVDARYKVLYFNVGAEGSANDASIYQASDFFEKLEVTGEIRFPEVSPNDPLQVPYHLVGDDGFTLSKFMMKPYSYSTGNPTEKLFNYRLSRARRVSENVFGIMANRWRVLRRPNKQEYHHVRSVVKACVVLHNFLRERRPLEELEIDENNDGEDSQESINHENEEEPINADDPRMLRDQLADWFINEGEVPFQYGYALRTTRNMQ